METHYNLNYLKEISNGDVDFEKDIINTFLKNIPEEMEQLVNAIEEKSIEKVHYYSHKMKPSLQVLQVSCAENLKFIENESKSEIKNWEIIEKNYRNAQEVLAAVIEALHNINF